MDRELRDKYGTGLQKTLDVERRRLGPEDLPRGEVIRLHPGKLHCDLLAWVVTRDSEPGSSRGPAPGREAIQQAVLSALQFCAERNVLRIAFPALGDGPSELEPEDRLALIVETARGYEDECFSKGRPPVVEEVIVCEPSVRVLGSAKRKVAKLARTAPDDPNSKKVERAAAPKKARKSRATGTGRGRASSVRRLDPAEMEVGRGRAIPYDRTQCYATGQWVRHTKFGLGRVESTTVDKKMELLFESGDIKTLIHDRS